MLCTYINFREKIIQILTFNFKSFRNISRHALINRLIVLFPESYRNFPSKLFRRWFPFPRIHYNSNSALATSQLSHFISIFHFSRSTGANGKMAEWQHTDSDRRWRFHGSSRNCQSSGNSARQTWYTQQHLRVPSIQYEARSAGRADGTGWNAM